MLENYHLLTSLMYLPAVVGISALSFVLFVQRRIASSIAFSIFSFTLALWLLPQYLAQLFPTVEGYTYPLQLLQLDSAIANFCALSFLIFLLLYTGLWGRYKKLVWVAGGFASAFAALSFTPLMITRVESSWNGLVIKEAGLLYSLQIGLLLILFIAGVVALLRSTVKMPPHRRTSNYLLILAIGQGVGTSLLASIFFASTIAAQVLVPIALFVMVAIIGFAIIKHRLFDLHLIVARAVGYALSLFVLGACFVATGVILGRLFFSDVHVPQSVTLVYSILALLIAFGFQPVKQRFDKVSNKFFYRDAYDAQEFFNELNDILVSTLDLNRLVARTSDLIVTRIKTGYCSVALLDEKTKKFRIIGDGYSVGVRDLEAIHDNSLVKSRKQRTVVTDLLDEQDSRDLVHLLNRNEIAVLSQLRSSENRKAIGYILVGQKKSGNLYSHQDIRVFEAVANELVIAIQNALRYGEIERFNETLQQKVEDATRQLRESNKKLKQLNESKDDFIGMASHQLRTPLTSVKGYISLVMDGDAGKINASQRQLLQQAFASSQKMVYLIADLLNVSRLKTGKFVIERSQINLDKLISEEMGQLQHEAAGRGLELTYEAPKNFPILPLDETKTRQVIMNFLDNAIYYTPSGGHIRAELKELPKSVEFRVIDDGIGVPKEDRHHLFTKFYRARNAQRARPDGTGLGLYMAKKVITTQGGAIIFSSEEGKGSTFGFIFPKDMPSGNVALPAQTRD